MPMKNSTDWCGCPFRFGASVLGDPWLLLILRDIMFKNARYYADFLNAGEGISTNILATRLAHLENEGLLLKAKDPNDGSRFIYSLTEKGIALIPVMLELVDWSETWDDKTEVPKEFADNLRENRSEVARSFAQQLRSDDAGEG